MNNFILILVLIAFVLIGVFTISYAVQECGWGALFVRDSFWMAISGMCE